MKPLQTWFTRGAEFTAAMALAEIFVTFLLQILFRYVPFLEPIGWSVVLISLLWVFVIFFGCAFVVREKDHVTFDILYLAAAHPVRRVLALITADIMNAGTISDRLLQFCVALVGRFRGGLGHVSVVASLIFSGMSGSAVADAAGIGAIIIDMMVKSGR